MATAAASKTPAYDFLKSAVARRQACTSRNKNRRNHHTYHAVLPWATDMVNQKAAEPRCLNLIKAFPNEVAALMPGNFYRNLSTVYSFIKQSTNQ